MSKKSKKKLKKKDRSPILKAAPNSRKAAKATKKVTAKVSADRNGHAAAKPKKGKLVYFFGERAQILLEKYLELALIVFLIVVVLGIAAAIYF